VLFVRLHRYREAETLLKRALAIRTEQLGHKHPDTLSTRRDLQALEQYREEPD
jgi:hypothetical protein